MAKGVRVNAKLNSGHGIKQPTLFFAVELSKASSQCMHSDVWHHVNKGTTEYSATNWQEPQTG